MDTANTPDLSGQVAIVTGGGRGIGRTVAQTLAAAHAAVAIVARTQAELDETAHLITQCGGTALVVCADISDRQSVETMIQRVEQELGAVDLLVNNSGILGTIGPIWEFDPDEWWRAIDVNLYGAFLCGVGVMKRMVGRKRGRIINVSSSAALFPIPFGSAYGISKAALARLTEFMAAEGKAHGIVAFTIDPGAVRTAMLNYLIEFEPAQTWIPHIHKYAVEVGVFNSAEQSANLLLRLASGQVDSLSGRFFQVTDDLERLITQAEQISEE